ncbi:MAG: hypothetical protein V1745_04400 [Patescibacteria group bacterium]
MTPRHSLITVVVFGLVGTLFAGYLTMLEYIAPGTASCSVTASLGPALGAPPCVYGFVMFVTITIIASLGLRKTT